MSLISDISSYYSAVESLVKNITISHLYSLDIRRIIGEQGISEADYQC